jgi:hypothetical protein
MLFLFHIYRYLYLHPKYFWQVENVQAVLVNIRILKFRRGCKVYPYRVIYRLFYIKQPSITLKTASALFLPLKKTKGIIFSKPR